MVCDDQNEGRGSDGGHPRRHRHGAYCSRGGAPSMGEGEEAGACRGADGVSYAYPSSVPYPRLTRGQAVEEEEEGVVDGGGAR